MTRGAAEHDNPAVLICDSDALFQLLLSNLLQPLRELKRKYEIQPVITPEVEWELLSNKRYSKRVEPSVRKAISSGLLPVLTPFTLGGIVGSASAVTIHKGIQDLGSKYRLIVQRGEAYSHAAGVVLGAPVLSNDFKAIKHLSTQGHKVAAPTIRAFDLLAFGVQVGCLRTNDCKGFLHQMLVQERNEYIPREFCNTSFEKGIGAFSCRLLDGDQAPIGAANPSQIGSSSTLFIRVPGTNAESGLALAAEANPEPDRPNDPQSEPK